MPKLTVNLHPSTPRWLQTVIAGLLFIAIAIALQGVLLKVEYSWVPVVNVQTVAGQDARHRAVLVQTAKRMRLIRVSDPFIRTKQGQLVCLARRTLLARRWLRYSVVLPGYCRSVVPPPQSGDIRAGIQRAPLAERIGTP